MRNRRWAVRLRRQEERRLVLSAHDVAREIRRRLPRAGVVKVHKLLYYCQAWHLVFTGRPMFSEPIEAWANGPVVKNVWADEKHDREMPSPKAIDASAAQTIGYVVERYGRFTGKQLIALTHDEAPWREVATRDDVARFLDTTISHESMRSYFLSDEEATSSIAWARAAMREPDVRARVEAALDEVGDEPGQQDSPERLTSYIASLSQ